MPVWTQSGSLQLHIAVRTLGKRWRLIAATGQFPGRSATALRLQWGLIDHGAMDTVRLEREARGAELSCQVDAVMAGAGLNLRQRNVSDEEDVVVLQATAVPADDAEEAVSSSVRQREALRIPGKHRWPINYSHRKSWTCALKIHETSERPLAKHILRMATDWRLLDYRNGNEILAVEFRRARARALQKGWTPGCKVPKGSVLTWGLAFTSGQRLPTFRVARARRIYVIGRGMYLRRMSPREVAILMGMELCTYVHAAQRLFPLASQDDWLHGMIVDSIDFRMVGTLLDNGFEMRAFEDQYIRYGSLFSGGCEAMVNGFRRRRMQVDHVMAVEIEDRRRDAYSEKRAGRPFCSRRCCKWRTWLGEEHRWAGSTGFTPARHAARRAAGIQPHRWATLKSRRRHESISRRSWRWRKRRGLYTSASSRRKV